VRQLLSDKISGTLVGIWTLVPEHLRLGTWDLLCGWVGRAGATVFPRLALQMVHEAALCTCSLRATRCLSQKGFELANGLPWVATDPAIHELLDCINVERTQALQIAFGKIRRASGHFRGRLLGLDPHRMPSYSKRQAIRRRTKKAAAPIKTAQSFFCLDADTAQPVAFTTGTAARTVAQATPGLLDLASRILQPDQRRVLVLADTEHVCLDLIKRVRRESPFDLFVPLHQRRHLQKRYRAIPPEEFTRAWAGFAVARHSYDPAKAPGIDLLVQRSGEPPGECGFRGFLTTSDEPALESLTRDYPQRWHVEEFFNSNQQLGWNRGGTLNLNIRYAQMTMSLLAQGAIHQLRNRLGKPFRDWNAQHLAENLLRGLDGDVRVVDDTIVVTFYNAPNSQQLREHLENLPAKLSSEGVDPRVPWLYNFKLDFRFK